MIENLLINLEPYFEAVAIILIHSLWQGAVIGFLAAVALILLRKSSARTRYAVSCAAMGVFIAAGAVTLASVLSSDVGYPEDTRAAAVRPAIEVSIQQNGEAVYFRSAENDELSPGSWWKRPLINRGIFAGWILGAVLISIYHLFGWHRARGFVRLGTSPVPPRWQTRFEKLRNEFGIRHFVPLLSSSLVKVPCVVGWMKPAVLIPIGMFTWLSPAEIEMILVHELAHIRRYDVLVNIVQTFMETLFFFNPAIWWLSRQIRIERENCCDDAAILRSGNRLRYARALTNMEEFKLFKVNFGSALTGTPLKCRIQRIVGINKPCFFSSFLNIPGLLLLASLIVIVFGSIGGPANSMALADEKIGSTQAFEPEPDDLSGEWETESDGNELKILVYGRESSGMNFSLERDEVAHLIGQGKKSFRITRDAGTLFLEGTLEERRHEVTGRGDWYFRPDSAYVRFMSNYGLHEDDHGKVLSLAIFDISREYVSEMEEYGYRNLNIDQLISAGVFDISPELVEDFRNAGYPDLTYNQLLSIRVQGVRPEDAREFEKSGAGHLTADQLISAKIHNITPKFVKEFREAGFRDLSFNSFVTLRAFNLDVNDFEDCYSHRFMELSEDNMVWVCGFGITLKDIEEMKKRGYSDIDTIIKILAQKYGK